LEHLGIFRFPADQHIVKLILKAAKIEEEKDADKWKYENHGNFKDEPDCTHPFPVVPITQVIVNDEKAGTNEYQ
jgi:hypothetical protein